MGLEEHLLHMFREDPEFHDDAGASHHGGAHAANDAGGPAPRPAASPRDISGQKTPGEVVWLSDAERELKKIPFFVRGKAKRNTESFAAERGVTEIDIDTLYEAKAHYAR
jgi:light-independent protochlorophyllide reductase subunit B